MKSTIITFVAIASFSLLFGFEEKAPRKYMVDDFIPWTLNIPATPHVPGAYSQTPPSGCEGSAVVCGILAPDNDGQPDLNAEIPDDPEERTVADFITEALGSGEPNDYVSLKPDL